MADLADVSAALVTLVASIAYPNGTGAPSVITAPIIVYAGWPNPATLTPDLAAGKVHVSIFPRPNDRETSVFMGDGEWDEATNDGTRGVGVRELRRQTRTFQVTVWTGRYDSRDSLAGLIDAGLAAVTRLPLADATVAMVSYVNSAQSDDEQKAGIYRRDLFYALNYAVIQTEAQVAIREVDTSTANVTDAAATDGARLGPIVRIATTASGTATTITP